MVTKGRQPAPAAYETDYIDVSTRRFHKFAAIPLPGEESVRYVRAWHNPFSNCFERLEHPHHDPPSAYA